MTKKTTRSRRPTRTAGAVLGGALLAALATVVRRAAARTAERRRTPEPETAGSGAEHRPGDEPDEVRV
ncbi:hypothetical protein MW084_18475, partial [Streptomyces sudanensis]